MQIGATLTRNRGDVISAFQYGLIVSILTALIGLANATRIFGELDRNTILTHLHSGTLGWITMGVIGVAIWIFGGSSASLRTPVRLSALVTALYVLAFWSGNFYARAATGVAEMVVILGWWLWIWRRAMAAGGFGGMALHQLALTLSFTTLVIGSILGVAAQILYATGAMTPELGAKVIGDHASAQVAGYLVLAAVALGERFLSKSGGARSTAGLIQIYLLFLAGLSIAAGEGLGISPLTMISPLLQTVAIVIYLVRLGGAAVGTSWGSPAGARYPAISVPFLLMSIVLFGYVVSLLGQYQGDFTKIPPGVIHALDHAMFIGVMTNVLFGLIRSLDGKDGGLVDHVVFAGMNIGALGFITALVFVGAHTEAVRATAPIMGVSALLGIGIFLSRLRAEPA